MRPLVLTLPLVLVALGAPTAHPDLQATHTAQAPRAPHASIVAGTYTLTSVSSSQLMDVSGASTANGGPVIQWPWNGGANQEWTVNPDSSGTYTLASANSGKCLEVPGGSTTQGVQLDQSTCTGGTNQQWTIQPVGDGSYTLAAVNSGQLADVKGVSTNSGTPIIQWPANGGANQHWRFAPLTRAGGWAAGLELQGAGFTDQTIRMVVHSTAAGSLVRVRLSNLYGSSPLPVGAVDVAVQNANGTAVSGTHHAAYFSGAATATVAAQSELTSDPIPMHVNADQDLLVSLYLPTATTSSTWHADAHDTTYLASGDHVADDSTTAYTQTSGSWFYLSGLDVISPTATGTVVAIGDSITDGVGSTVGGNARWPDDLARLLNAAPSGTTRGVVDEGIGSNRVLTDAGTANPSLLKRFAHDALAQPDLKDVILLEGINDIGNNAGPNGAALTAQDLISAYQTLISQAHAAGVKIYGATILPYQGCFYYTANGEQIRETVNQWIRTSGAFDAAIDLDAAVRDPNNPLALLPAYDRGDHLHPSNAGYQAMANAIPLNLLQGS